METKDKKVQVVRIPTHEEMKAEAGKKIPMLDELQQKILLQQEHLNKLNQLFVDREKFLKVHADIKHFQKSIVSAITSGLIESPEHKIWFTEKGSYRDEPSFFVSSPEVLNDFLQFIDERIKTKLQELDASIVTLAA